MTTLSDNELRRTVDEYERTRSISRTATELGLARSTVRDRLVTAASRGIGAHYLASPTPKGLSITGTTTLYGPTGEARLQWVKTRSEQLELTIDAIKEAFSELATKPTVSKPDVLTFADSELVTVVPIADLHFGMYSWKEEVGDSYDTAIAKRVLSEAYEQVMARSVASDFGVILNLGDFFHSDNDEQKTRRSGNKLDVDTRYARVLREGVQLLIQIIEQAKQKHKHVLVKNVPGNHDPYGSIALTTALAARYANDQHVIVDTDASPIWHFRFGKTLIVAAHGDMARPMDMPGISAARFPKEWGETAWRYAYLGHIHKRRVWKNKPDSNEFGGMEVEVFRTVAPKDSWGAQKGFTSRRSLVAITHHRDMGEVNRVTENIT